MLVDTHCHLNFKSFNSDREDVIARASQFGIGRILNPGIDLQTSREAVELAENYEEVYAAVGVHPNESKSWTENTSEELKFLANNPKVVAVGEIGLDYYRDRAPKVLQQQVLKNQLELAAEMELPVVIHTRNADEHDIGAVEDTLSILSDWVESRLANNIRIETPPGVLHSFSGNVPLMEKAACLGLFIGITGPVTFKNADLLREVVKVAPIESLLVETDAPFLTPHPHRGKRNEPANVRFVAEAIANVRGQSFEQVMGATTSNAKRIFNW